MKVNSLEFRNRKVFFFVCLWFYGQVDVIAWKQFKVNKKKKKRKKSQRQSKVLERAFLISCKPVEIQQTKSWQQQKQKS